VHSAEPLCSEPAPARLLLGTPGRGRKRFRHRPPPTRVATGRRVGTARVARNVRPPGYHRRS
jgi:hypothetical protein